MKIAPLAGLCLLLLAGFGVRWAVLQANIDTYGGDLPFTLESALQFRSTQMVYEGEGIPRLDPMIQYPEGIASFRTDTIMAEYVYACLARLLPDSMPLSDRVRWITVFWFSLSIPWLACWVAWWTRSRTAGIWAALFYAVSLASVIRSTGIEISRENFAIPFLVAHLALDARLARNDLRAGRRAMAWGSALTLGLALATWDMIQFYVILWSVWWWFRCLRSPGLSGVDAGRWMYPSIALIVVGLLSPYHRRHGLLFSPGLWFVYGVWLVYFISCYRSMTMWQRWACGLAPAVLLACWPFAYEAHYGHFGELALAKVRHLNVKPSDPSLLSFNQRILWVPALDSATWPLTRMLYPATLWLIVIAFASVLLSGVRRRITVVGAGWPQYTFFFCSSLIAYVLFVRFHVYLMLFAVWVLGMWWAWARRRGGVWPYVVGMVLAGGMTVEALHVLENPARWGRPNVYYRELQELKEWLLEESDGEPVLANFGVSAFILTYAGNPIILHPKFETPEIRHRMEDYGRTLFKGTEEAFRDWADRHGARYYVHALGEFATRQPELQMRYFVDALAPPPYAAARIFEERPEAANYFEMLWGNRKYRVFRVISRMDEEMADQLTIWAEHALAEGNLAQAEEYAWAALALFPAQYRAREVVRHVTSLRDRGFSYEERIQID